MLDEIRRRLKDGEKVDLECIDRVGFTDPGPGDNTEILKQDSLTVSHIDMYDRVHLKGELSGWYNYISPEELKYFKIKEEASVCNKMGGSVTVITGDNRSKVAFDKLIDTVVKGVKDGIITVDYLDKVSVVIRDVVKVDKVISVYSHNHVAVIQSIIKTIESLYVETFVVEDADSLLRMNKNIKSLVLANGCDIADRIGHDICGIYFKDDWGNSAILNIDMLKGATVTQTKGDE